MKTKSFGVAYRMAVVAVVVSLLAFGNPGRVSAGKVIYVKWSPISYGDGTSWLYAYDNLKTALFNASIGDQIWVARGTYIPNPHYNTDRTLSFEMKDGVAVYGGFAATETSLNQRNWKTNVTVLSGDIGVIGDASDNSYHVVTAQNVTSSSILDGFTITGGNANGASPYDSGGGIYNSSANSTLRNLIFRDNAATNYGGAIFSSNGSPMLRNVTFTDNSARDGGAVWNIDSNPQLANVTFINNRATFNGGAMFMAGNSSPTFINVTFSVNSAGNHGGALASVCTYCSASFADVTFTSNAAEEGGALYTVNSTSTFALTNATFSGNSATNGGALYSSLSAMTSLANATLTGNSAANGGAIYNYGLSNVTITNATFSGNSASNGGAMNNDSRSQAYIYNSIFWGDGTSEFSVALDVGAVIISNSIVQGGCPAGLAVSCTHVVNADPILGPLAPHGGFTQTMALGLGTAAIDMSLTNCPALDQRGAPRPQGPGCDAGAYEAHALPFRSKPASDGYITETGQATEKGGPAYALASTLLVGDDALNRRYRSLLSFDTSPLQGKTPIFALLRLRKQSMLSNPFATQGGLVSDLAAPYFGTQLSLVSSDFETAPLVQAAGRPLVQIGNGWYRSVLRPAAVARINTYSTTQLRLRFNAETYNGVAEHIAFCSGEANIPTCLAAYRPVLWVYYTP